MEEKLENFIAEVRKRGNASSHQGENKRKRKQKSEPEHIKRVTRKLLAFLLVVVQNNGKQMYKKKCAARAKLF